MMKKNRMKPAAVFGFLLAWMLILFVLAAAIYGMAGNAGLITDEMLRHAPPGDTGLPETDYPGVGRMITDYLTGRRTDFQYYRSDAEGNSYACFRKHEADHMADCRGLIRLAGTLRWITGGITLILLGTGPLMRAARKTFAQGVLRGLEIAAAAGLLILIWAAVDFDGLFVTFHRLAFTNDGWLLDTRTDLLIRLMPVSFFVSLGARLLLWTGAAGIAAGIAAMMIKKQKGKVQYS